MCALESRLLVCAKRNIVFCFSLAFSLSEAEAGTRGTKPLADRWHPTYRTACWCYRRLLTSFFNLTWTSPGSWVARLFGCLTEGNNSLPFLTWSRTRIQFYRLEPCTTEGKATRLQLQGWDELSEMSVSSEENPVPQVCERQLQLWEGSPWVTLRCLIIFSIPQYKTHMEANVFYVQL